MHVLLWLGNPPNCTISRLWSGIRVSWAPFFKKQVRYCHLWAVHTGRFFSAKRLNIIFCAPNCAPNACIGWYRCRSQQLGQCRPCYSHRSKGLNHCHLRLYYFYGYSSMSMWKILQFLRASPALASERSKHFIFSSKAQSFVWLETSQTAFLEIFSRIWGLVRYCGSGTWLFAPPLARFLDFSNYKCQTTEHLNFI